MYTARTYIMVHTKVCDMSQNRRDRNAFEAQGTPLEALGTPLEIEGTPAIARETPRDWFDGLRTSELWSGLKIKLRTSEKKKKSCGFSVVNSRLVPINTEPAPNNIRPAPIISFSTAFNQADSLTDLTALARSRNQTSSNELTNPKLTENGSSERSSTDQTKERSSTDRSIEKSSTYRSTEKTSDRSKVPSSLETKVKSVKSDLRRLRSKSCDRILKRRKTPMQTFPAAELLTNSAAGLDEEYFQMNATLRRRSRRLSDSRVAHPGPFVGVARALVDCTPSPYDTHALKFKAGDLISIIERRPSGIWSGSLGNRTGNFKFICVEPLDQANELNTLNLSRAPASMSDLLSYLDLQHLTSRLTLNGWDELDKLTGVTRTDLTYLGIEEKEQDAILSAVAGLHVSNNSGTLDSNIIPESRVYGTQDRGVYGSQDSRVYGTQDRGVYGTQDRGVYGTQDRGVYGSQDSKVPGLPDKTSGRCPWDRKLTRMDSGYYEVNSSVDSKSSVYSNQYFDDTALYSNKYFDEEIEELTTKFEPAITLFEPEAKEAKKPRFPSPEPESLGIKVHRFPSSTSKLSISEPTNLLTKSF